MPTLVELLPHDPNWAREFSAAEEMLRTMLGIRVLAIDHVGSTAVSGMLAKPIIDIDVTLSSSAHLPGASADLVNAGFEPRGNRYDDNVWAFLWRRAQPQIRAYLCPPLSPTHQRRMIFRDYLRQHEEAAAAYSILKRRLAEQFPYDGDRYTFEKTAFISQIVSKAQGHRQ